MAGIVNSTKKRLLINKKIKEVEVPTAVLNTSQFLVDLNTVGGNANQALILAELADLPTIVKNECVTALVCGAYKEGKVYGYNGDTKSIEEFTFVRQSAGTRINASGQVELVPANVPRADYNAANGQLKGYLLEYASTNLFTDSGVLNGLNTFSPKSLFGLTAVDTLFNAGEVLSKGLQIDKVEGSVPYAYKICNVTIGLKYAFSFYAKALDSSLLTTADISVAIQGSPIASSAVEFEPVANGLTRVKCTFTVTTGSTTFGVLKPANSSGKSIIVTGFQLELNEVTSLIPTTSAEVTRLSDKITSNRDIVSFQEASIYVNGDFANPTGAINVILYKDFNTSRFLCTALSGPSIRSYGNGNNVAINQVDKDYTKPSKTVVSYSKTNFALTVNGLTKKSTVAFTSGTELLTIVGSPAVHIRSLAIVPRDLTDSELVTVTT